MCRRPDDYLALMWVLLRREEHWVEQLQHQELENNIHPSEALQTVGDEEREADLDMRELPTPQPAAAPANGCASDPVSRL